MQFGLLAESLFFGDQAVWQRVHAGVLVSGSSEGPASGALERPGVAEWWNRNRHRFRTDHADAVDATRSG